MKIPLHESPYFVPGVTDVAYAFGEDEFGGRAFRVFGIPERWSNDGGIQSALEPLKWDQAERACADVGIGLAAVANSARKEALDAALLAAEKSLPAVYDPAFWIGGYRTSLSDPRCLSGPVTSYPYFTGDDAGTYSGCGKHTFHDWAWSRPSADGSFDDTDKQFILWREHRGPEEYWDIYEHTGLDKNDPQPTGWYGAFNLKGWPFGGDYENCTAAHVFAVDDPDIIKAARGRAYYDDYACYNGLSRWVCEMREVDAGVDEGALLDRHVPVLGSPYYIPGVTSEGRMVNSRTYFRIFGVTPNRAALFQSYEGDKEAELQVSWANAQEACISAGGDGLAVSRFGSYSIERAALMSSISRTLSLSYNVVAFNAWLGGATTLEATTNASSLEAADFSWYEQYEPKFSLESGQQQWTAGWPKAGPAHVAAADQDHQETSCIASVWNPAVSPAVQGTFQNFICEDSAIRYFMCTFSSEQTGMKAPPPPPPPNASADAPLTPPTLNSSAETSVLAPEADIAGDISASHNDSNIAPVVGSAVAGFLLLAVLVVAGFFVIRRRPRRNRARSRHFVAPNADPDAEAHLSAVSEKGLSAAQCHAAPHGNGLGVQAVKQSEPSHVTSEEGDAKQGTWVTMTIGASTEWAAQFMRPGYVHPAVAVPSVLPLQVQAKPREALFDLEQREASLRTAAESQERDAHGGAWVTMTAGSSTQWATQSTRENNVRPAVAGHSAAPMASNGTTIVAEYEGMDCMTRLQAQLHGLLAEGGMFAKKYVLGDLKDCRKGGQGAVHFASHRFNGYEYAIKFFFSRSAFFTEKALYESPLLQRVLPNIEDMADPTAPERDHLGVPLPPYIVMERGEALDEWSMRASPDLPTTCQVLSHLATRLAELHASKLVHRDLKPGNVMWLPGENRWTLIDFGCVANAGSQALISYSLSYAAPEVIAAADALQAGTGPHTMLVTPALDAWSIGVMIFRMLTTPPGKPMRAGVITIEMLRGEEQLPWEGPNLTQAKRRSLGVLKTPVLKLLSRDPALRSSMAELKAQCDDIFAGKTTNASGDDAAA